MLRSSLALLQFYLHVPVHASVTVANGPGRKGTLGDPSKGGGGGREKGIKTGQWRPRDEGGGGQGLVHVTTKETTEGRLQRGRAAG